MKDSVAKSVSEKVFRLERANKNLRLALNKFKRAEWNTEHQTGKKFCPICEAYKTVSHDADCPFFNLDEVDDTSRPVVISEKTCLQ